MVKHSIATLKRMSSEETDRHAAYVASMPPAYRRSFDVETTRLHAQIVSRREDRGAHVEIWKELSERVVGICVVADDKPGLLSGISAALVEQRIDVVSADAYCRTRPDGRVEAIDFLYIRRLPSARGSVAPIRARDILALAAAIESADVDSVVPSVAPPAPGASARVRFDEGEHGATLLTVEAVDRPGLLLAVTQALFRAGVQIVGLRATTEQGSAIDRFHLVEPNGQPLQKPRLLELQCAILAALEEGVLSQSA